MPGRKREGYYYAPITLEIIKILDNLANEEGRRYGIDGRAEMVRSVLGTFVELYEIMGPGSLNAVKRMIIETKKQKEEEENEEESKEDNDDSSSSVSPSLRIKCI